MPQDCLLPLRFGLPSSRDPFSESEDGRAAVFVNGEFVGALTREEFVAADLAEEEAPLLIADVGLVEPPAELLRSVAAAAGTDVRQVAPMSRYVNDVVLEERTGISRHTWRKWRQRAYGPPYVKLDGSDRGLRGRAGRTIYDWDEVVQWFDARKVGASLSSRLPRRRRRR